MYFDFTYSTVITYSVGCVALHNDRVKYIYKYHRYGKKTRPRTTTHKNDKILHWKITVRRVWHPVPTPVLALKCTRTPTWSWKRSGPSDHPVHTCVGFNDITWWDGGQTRKELRGTAVEVVGVKGAAATAKGRGLYARERRWQSFISITKTSLAFRLSRPRDTAPRPPPPPTLIPNYYAPFCPSRQSRAKRFWF